MAPTLDQLGVAVLSSRWRQPSPATHHNFIRRAIGYGIIQPQDHMHVIIEHRVSTDFDRKDPGKFLQLLSLPPSQIDSSLPLGVAHLLPLLPIFLTFACRECIREKTNDNGCPCLWFQPEVWAFGRSWDEGSWAAVDRPAFGLAPGTPLRLHLCRALASARAMSILVVVIPMGKGVANMTRNREISMAANRRYLETLAVVPDSGHLKEQIRKIGRRTRTDTRSHRALNPACREDVDLLAAVMRGEHSLEGFRNADIREQINKPATNDGERRQAACQSLGR